MVLREAALMSWHLRFQIEIRYCDLILRREQI